MLKLDQASVELQRAIVAPLVEDAGFRGTVMRRMFGSELMGVLSFDEDRAFQRFLGEAMPRASLSWKLLYGDDHLISVRNASHELVHTGVALLPPNATGVAAYVHLALNSGIASAYGNPDVLIEEMQAMLWGAPSGSRKLGHLTFMQCLSDRFRNYVFPGSEMRTLKDRIGQDALNDSFDFFFRESDVVLGLVSGLNLSDRPALEAVYIRVFKLLLMNVFMKDFELNLSSADVQTAERIAVELRGLLEFCDYVFYFLMQKHHPLQMWIHDHAERIDSPKAPFEIWRSEVMSVSFPVELRPLS